MVEEKNNKVNKENIIQKIENDARAYMEERHMSGHDFAHLDRVRKLSKYIGKVENADLFILESAALLHDLGREAERKNPTIDHAIESAEVARIILNQFKYNIIHQQSIDQILYAIRNHRYGKHGKDIIPLTLEARIIQDADRIDACGAIGIARVFAHHKKRDLYNCKDPFAENRILNDEQYSLDHFYSKILNLPEVMHTETGKKMATERIKFVKLFLEQFQKEVNLEVYLDNIVDL